MNIKKIKVFEDISIPGVNLKDSVEKTIRRIYMGGYVSGAEATRDKAIEAFCMSMQAGPTGCDRRKPCGCKRQCGALKKFIQLLDKQ